MDVDYSASNNPLARYFSYQSSSRIIKNGTEVSPFAIKKYDVVYYLPAGDTYIVTDSKVSGVWESSYPIPSAPDSVTVLGASYPVLPSAKASFKNYTPGGRLTLLLTDDGKVAGVAEAMEIWEYGIMLSANETSATIKRLDGSVVTISSMNPFSIYSRNNIGRPVIFTAGIDRGRVSLVDIEFFYGPDCDFEAMTIGKYPIAKNVTILESADGLTVSGIMSLSDIDYASLSGRKVRAYSLNEFGYADLIMVQNVTTKAYKYGSLSKKNIGGGQVECTFVYADENGAQASVSFIREDIAANAYARYTGLAFDVSGAVSNILNAVSLGKASRNDFFFDESVKIGGTTYKINESVTVYNAATGRIMTLTEAKAQFSSFGIYLDKPVEDGGSVRLIVVGE